MKTWTLSVLGKDLLTVTVHDDEEYEYEDDEEDEDEDVLIPCMRCGEPFDAIEETMSRRFADMTERLVWDVRTDDYPPHPMD